ncbi:hypothetical protein [Streptomyces cavernicola]|uniref:DUF1963 domain-containing protein n=1 Tax=Streptomyces cavernicola TaxID=3043613 RepID=A0ABT6S581_9ACTN|nr:hypothetical protein [Streptomyces sp. B-S-A6]MDI3403250.1 hypothetical protein [Streptomyces sp. B-S-A6]
MTRTTPPRPLDVEALFPELAAYRGTTTRLHPRPGSPDISSSSVGGPLLWPRDEPWPVCTEPHARGAGRRPADIHRERQVLAAAWDRAPDAGPTEQERALLKELAQKHRVAGLADTDPLPMLGVAQFYRRDLPDLPAGPDGADLLQVFWCPFDRHGRTGYGMSLDLRWHRSSEVTEMLPAPPRPAVVGFEGYVPQPCVLHPEQVTTYPFAGLLPDELCARIDAWEEALEEEASAAPDDAPGPPAYQYDLSIPPGWRVGGFASWHVTDPSPMDCHACGAPMDLLLTIDSREWDGGNGSWKPLEDRDLPAHRSALPTEVAVGRWGQLNVFSCPATRSHPHRWSVQ